MLLDYPQDVFDIVTLWPKADYSELAKWLRHLAYNNHPTAQMLFGYFHFAGFDTLPIDVDEGLIWLQRASEQGDLDAMCLEADHLYIKNKWFKATRLFFQAAQRGHDYALIRLYYSGFLRDQDIVEFYFKLTDEALHDALNRMTQKASTGNILYTCWVGYCYDMGYATQKDDTRAMQWYSVAATNGNAIAQLHLGYLYCSTDCKIKDKTLAAKWWEQAAIQGNVYAQVHMWICYRDGDGVSRSKEAQLYWLHEASLNNHIESQMELGRTMLLGSSPPVGFFWMQKAAMGGYENAQYELAECYLRGSGTLKNIDQAAKWILKAASAGHTRAINVLSRDHTLVKAVNRIITRVLLIGFYKSRIEDGCYLPSLPKDILKYLIKQYLLK